MNAPPRKRKLTSGASLPSPATGDPSHGGDPGESWASLQLAHVRLQQLYDIGKLFARFESAERTLDPALGIAARTLSVRSAILIETEADHAKMIVWPSQPLSSPADALAMQAVKEHIVAAYTYLVGPASAESLAAVTEQAGLTALPVVESGVDGGKQRIVIPLVVAEGQPFGALQVEGGLPLDKSDLNFINAIANQLAVALDRDRVRRREITLRIDAERERALAVERGAEAERERVIADALRRKFEAVAAENARLHEQAREAVLAREHILAIVSHDLRNPIGTILLTAGGLAATNVPAERRQDLPQAVGRIQRAAARMLRLVEDLLDFASIEAGRLAIACRPLDPGAIVHEAAASFENLAERKGQILTVDVEPGLRKVHCDHDRVLQVLSNLMSNALKATSASGKIGIKVEDRGDTMHFAVSDDGPGINEADLPHLFERYWRGDYARYKGSGLGLAIAREIISAHGGRIWAESQLGRGTTVSFTIPTGEPAPGNC